MNSRTVPLGGISVVAQTYDAIVRKRTRQEHEPGETEGDEEIGDQRMTSRQAAKNGGRPCGRASQRRNLSLEE